MAAVAGSERHLTARLLQGLARLPGVTIQGPPGVSGRVPTVSFTHRTVAPATLSRALAWEGIFVWDGHNYALEVVRRLGLEHRGGVLRIGIAHYNTAEEVDRTLEALERALGA